MELAAVVAELEMGAIWVIVTAVTVSVNVHVPMSPWMSESVPKTV